LVALLAIGGAVYMAVPRRAPVVNAAPSVKAVEERLIVGAGRVEPLSEEIKVGSELEGRLGSVPVEEGERVRRGDVIATLENRDFEARVELAIATVAQREAELERLANGSRSEQRREAEAAVREAEAVLVHAQTEQRRRLALRDFGAISRSEFDAADREMGVAAARLEAARERLAVVNDETRPEDLKRARAELDRARAQLGEARALLLKTIIRSPIDGTILRKKLKAGENVSAWGEPVVTLGDCSRLRVRVDVDENDVARLHVGQAAWVRADAYGARKFRGKVMRIGQILGRKNVRTDEPSERVDAKILETIVELEAGSSIPIGMRVDAYIDPVVRSVDAGSANRYSALFFVE
jgi:HlyD family secretion protein